MPRTQCQATALEVLCRRTGPPARRWRGAGPCHGPLSHPTASSGPTGPWDRPGAAIEAHAAIHPAPQRCPRSATGRGRGRYASSIATVGCQETSGHCGVGQGPLSSSEGCQWHCMAKVWDVAPDELFPFPTGTSNELAVPATAAARCAGRACVEDVAGGVAAAVVEAQAGWIRSRRVVRAFRHGTIVDDGPWARGVTNLCSGSLLAPAA